MSNLRLRAIVLLLLLISPCGPTFRTQIKDKGAIFSLMASWNHNDTGNGTRNATSNGIESADSDYLKLAKDNTSTAQFNYLSAPQQIAEFEVLDFKRWIQSKETNIKPREIAHIKGFGAGMDIELCQKNVLDRLENYKLLIWDGDDFDQSKSGFTALLLKFLDQHPANRVVAFKLKEEREIFFASYQQIAQDYPKRLAVVLVDMENDVAHFPEIKAQLEHEKTLVPNTLPDWAMNYFILGRFAILMSGAKLVLSLGGGGVTKVEAEVCWQAWQARKRIEEIKEEIKKGLHKGKPLPGKPPLGSSVKWVVYALSRNNEKEKWPSLIDWAIEGQREMVEFITGIDRDEEKACAGAHGGSK